MSTYDPFEQEFRRRARGMRRTPNARNWQRIENRLDGRRAAIFGIRPWMIAAILVLFAGVAVFSVLTDGAPDVLAQRPQQIEEVDLSPERIAAPRIQDYAPLEEGRKDGYLVARNQPRLAVAPKYRS